MGIFNFLFGSKKQKESQQISVTVTQSKEFDYYRPEYFRIINSRPNMHEIVKQKVEENRLSQSLNIFSMITI